MASVYHSMSDAELDQVLAQLEIEGQALREKHLALDMARGKPSPEQTALSKPMLDLLTSTTNLIDGTVPVDNYFAPDGLPSARQLAAELIGVEPENVIVNGSSSLNLMHDLVAHAFAIGVCGNTPWCQQDRVKFLCPSPGYDRHFTVTAHYGIENIPIPMAPDGPDMDEICRLVETDPQVKGIWCVPKYSNPQGYTYSDETVRRFAALKPAASDFRIFWDNAYAVHDLYDEGDQLLNIFDALAETGGRDLIYEFASMAKVTFPGSGMAWVAASHTDIADIRAHFAAMRVCPEKISQFAHVAFLHDAAGVRAHMKKHAAVARPRFELVERKLTEGLGELGIASWTHPRGGYFVLFNGPRGSARAIVMLAKELGVTLTGAGATWPYGADPRDSDIRIAPTSPSLAALDQALDVFVCAVKLVCARMERDSRA